MNTNDRGTQTVIYNNSKNHRENTKFEDSVQLITSFKTNQKEKR